MTNLKKIFKYCAIALAVILIFWVIRGVIGTIGMLISMIGMRRDDRLPAQEDWTTISQGQWEQIRKLDMDIGGAYIEILEGEESMEISTDNPYIGIDVRGDTLRIKESSHVADLDSSHLTIWLPEGMTFEEAELSTGAGQLTVDALVCRELELDLGAGKAEFKSLTVTENADIDGGAGQVIISAGSLQDLDLDMGVGEAQLTAALTGDINLSAGVGALRLTVLGDSADYTIDADKGIGQLTIDGQGISGGVFGSGEHRIEVDGGIGNIAIEFSE